MLQKLNLLRNESIVNIKELQKSPSKYLQGITRIMRGKQTLGYFLGAQEFAELLEDIEAAESQNFAQSIQGAKADRFVTLGELEARYGLTPRDTQ